LFNQIYKNKRILVTGHTGFKGSWLSLWLCQLGAEVIGYSLSSPTSDSHAELLDVDCLSVIDDIRNAERLQEVISQERPEIIFHLAAQSLVRKSYQDSIETFSTNVMGTANVLNACKESSSVRAIVVVTSDKCYENQHLRRGYCETDPMGGYDPYSASKGCAEIIVSSYRRSYFPLEDYGNSHMTLVASARGGNVVGGGDWADDRLIPDIVRSVNRNEQLFIRNPNATRPWQHVLDCLSGYLVLGEKLLECKPEFADAWNFGPSQNANLSVSEILRRLQNFWPKISYQLDQQGELHEAELLELDCTKARSQLGWRPVWDIDKTLEMTCNWYRNFYECQEVISKQQLSEYEQAVKQQKDELIKI